MKKEVPVRFIVHGIVDGIVTSLGAILGASVSGDPRIIIITGITAAAGCAVADVTSIYTSTEAELLQEFCKLGFMMDVDTDVLKRSKVFTERKKKLIWKTTVDGITCLLGGLLLVVPFMLIPSVFPTVTDAVLFLLPLTVGVLAFLGFFIAKLSKEKALMLAIKTALVGLIAYAVTYALAAVLA